MNHLQLFDEELMYRYLETYAQNTEANNTIAALPFAKKMHEGQWRKGPEKIPYIVHPLSIACHALALGFCQDELIATILLHDVCEDCKDESGNPIPPEILPVCDIVKEAVGLLTKPAEEYEGWEETYYRGIAGNRLATITKVLDRCNNLSTMSASFSGEKMKKYVLASEEYVLPLLEEMEQEYGDACYSAVFLLRYQMMGLLRTFERLL